MTTGQQDHDTTASEQEQRGPQAAGGTTGGEDQVQAGSAVPQELDPSSDAQLDSPQQDGGEATGPDASELTVLLEDARAKADDTHNQLLRVRAEMENMKRRQSKELANAHKFALEGFVKELLQVRDSLELGKAAADAPDAGVEKLREGTELTLKLLTDVMTKFGVERIDPEGEPFDPEYHQAMSMQPRADVPPNTVVSVVQSGYLLNGRLMRPALVMVSQAA
jgi:molecular chaperone GrpE